MMQPKQSAMADERVRTVWRWLVDEAQDRNSLAIHWASDYARGRCQWDVVVADAPQQRNGYDCGVFVLMYARAIALQTVPTSREEALQEQWRPVEWHFDQQDISDLARMHILAVMMSPTTEDQAATELNDNLHNGLRATKRRVEE